MLKPAVTVGVAVLALAAAPARADLHYTTRTEARPVTQRAGANPVPAATADMLVKMLLPDGVAETTYWVSAQGTRIEMVNANMMMPAGVIVLRFANHDAPVVLNPRDHTYWRFGGIAIGFGVEPATPPPITAEMRELLAQMKPDVKVTPTGEYTTIAGVESERVTVSSTMTMPLPAGPGTPNAITSTADLWIAHQFDAYASSAMPAPALIGVISVPSQGFVMKVVGGAFPMSGVEFETVVTKIAEEPAPADAFEIPADYKEIAAPK